MTNDTLVRRRGRARTDVHRPTALVTEDYEYVFAEVNHLDMTPGWVLRLGDFGLEMSRWIHRTDKLDRGTHQCHHCGAHINYFAVLRHLPTGDAIVVGETCLDNRFELASADFHRLRKAAELDRQKMRIKGLRAAFVEANPDLAFMDEQPLEEIGNEFIRDVARRLRRYGELSERQIEAVRRAIVRDQKWEERRRLEPQPVKIPVLGQRVVLDGVVVSTRWEETDGYWSDSRKKALLVVPYMSGIYKVWVTIPRVVAGDVEKGDGLELRATISLPKHDPDADGTFGFGSHPYLVNHRTDEDEPLACGPRIDHVFWRCGCPHDEPAPVETLPASVEDETPPPCGDRRAHDNWDCDCPEDDEDQDEPVAGPPCGNAKAHAAWDCDCPDEAFESAS